MLSPQETVAKAADLIEQYGWRQYDVGSITRGFCVQGAVNQVVFGTTNDGYRGDEYTQAMYLVASKLNVGPPEFPDGDVCSWNNDKERTKREVVSTLREIAGEPVPA